MQDHKLITCCLICIIFYSMAITCSVNAQGNLSAANPRCEYKVNPVGIGVQRPRLTWEVQSNGRNVVQTAYQVRYAPARKGLKKPSGRKRAWTLSDAAKVVYTGPELESRQRVYWQVRVRDNHGNTSGWSDAAFFEMGLLDPSCWKAKWIQPGLQEDFSKPNPCPMLRKDFRVKGNIQSARAYVTAHGLYELKLNGQKVGDRVLTPGWTAYDERLQYQTYDVTDLLKQGENAVGAALGDGWFRGYLAWGGNRNTYGKRLALLMQLEIDYENGKTQLVISDENWKASTGPVLMSDIYNGETYDARLEKKGWSGPGYDDSDWSAVTVADHKKDILVAPIGPPVRKTQEIRPVEILKTPEGDKVVDMGQNMVGWVRLKVKGERGDKVVLRHAEVLDKKGNFYTANLRSAKQRIEYILKGTGEEVYEPHFTFQGFRYVAVEGYPGELTLDSLTGVVVHSDFRPAGTFQCSNSLINQLQHNIKWGQKGNFVDVPTDCPQRDERLGWTGDAQVFARTACFNADVASFYTKWLKDLACDQKPNGAVPHVIPNVLSHGKPTGAAGACGWADAGVIVPWTVYLCYGDTRILEQQYESMTEWIGYMRRQAGDSYLWNTGHHFGDWLAYNTTRSDYPGATTSKDLLATAYFAHSTSLVKRTAQILGKKDDAEEYGKLLKRIKEAFQDEFITPNGRLSSDTQTAYSVALGFDLMQKRLRDRAAQRLADAVNRFKHITTGFLGTPLICHVLSDHGYYDQAFMLLTRKKYPSWLYPVTKGATTIWERWDGIKPDGTFQNPGMNSFNHYAYGAIGDWLYRVVAGIEIDPEKPGYKHILVQPHPGGGLKYAKAAIHSMHGKVSSNWQLENGEFSLDVTVPANTTATVRLPSARLEEVTETGKKLTKAEGISSSSQAENAVMAELGSGNYKFSYPFK